MRLRAHDPFYDLRVRPDSEIVVRRGAFTAADPFDPPADRAAFALCRATDGGEPLLATNGSAWFDDCAFYVLFAALDDHRVATYRNHDDPLYEEDVVEVFLAPEDLAHYFEIEANPAGTTFDAAIVSPDGDRGTMKTDLAWDCAGLQVFQQLVHEEADHYEWLTLLVIPFASLGRSTPAPGETWRANFYRVDRHARGDEFSAWQPTMKSPPDFHVPAAFGTLRFA